MKLFEAKKLSDGSTVVGELFTFALFPLTCFVVPVDATNIREFQVDYFSIKPIG